MKIALMILFVFCGLAMSTMDAQTCAPCPPGCCKVENCVPGKSSASVNQDQAVQNALVSLSPEAMMAACEGKKMSKKDMKECQAVCLPVCQPSASVAPVGQTHTAVAPSTCSPKPTEAAKTAKSF